MGKSEASKAVARMSRSLEDCLEAMHMLQIEGKSIRVKYLAERLGIKPPSVVETLRRLDDLKLVSYEKYGDITLTERGEEVAAQIYLGHVTTSKFLTKVLKLDEKTAESDACRIEHVLSPLALRRLKKLIDFIENSPCERVRWIEHFEHYLKSGKYPPEVLEKA